MPPLRPTAPIAADALLLGDPARALRLSQELLVKPKMSNHAHGLWGYGGRTEDGHELTIQSLGIGGPSAALVLDRLAALGVRRAVQLGTCRAVAPDLALGELLVVGAAIGADGASSALAGGGELEPDPELGERLAAAACAAGVRAAVVASTDLLDGRTAAEWAGRGATALEMATAALLAAGPRRGVAVASLLAVSEAGAESIEDQALDEASLRMGRLALQALTSARG